MDTATRLSLMIDSLTVHTRFLVHVRLMELMKVRGIVLSQEGSPRLHMVA